MINIPGKNKYCVIRCNIINRLFLLIEKKTKNTSALPEKAKGWNEWIPLMTVSSGRCFVDVKHVGITEKIKLTR